MSKVAALTLPLFGLVGYLLYKGLHHESYSSSSSAPGTERPAGESTKPSGSGSGGFLESITNFFSPLSKAYPFDPDEYLGRGCLRVDYNALKSAQRALGRVLMYKDLAKKWGEYWGVPWALILAVIGTESSGNPRAYRYESHINDASRGLMQMLYSTAKSLGYKGPPEGLYNPDTSIYYGAKYLRKLYDRYGNWLDAIAAYNAGRPRRRKGFGCYWNQTYVNRVLTWLRELKRYGVK